MSAAVTIARTPGMASAAAASSRVMRPCPIGLRRNAACHMSVTLDVVDILAFAAQEALVLDAFDRAADIGVDRPHRALPSDSLR